MRPTTNEIRQALKTAFGVETTKQLKKFIRCDMRRRDEMLHAVATVWNYPNNYPAVKDMLALREIMVSLSTEELAKVKFDSMHGFGSHNRFSKEWKIGDTIQREDFEAGMVQAKVIARKGLKFIVKTTNGFEATSHQSFFEQRGWERVGA